MAYYGTISDGDTYFATKLRATAWTGATDADQEKALNMATRAIDQLNFKGDKYDEDQALEFPRDEDETVAGEGVGVEKTHQLNDE